jgi:hypothetical protein
MLKRQKSSGPAGDNPPRSGGCLRLRADRNERITTHDLRQGSLKAFLIAALLGADGQVQNGKAVTRSAHDRNSNSSSPSITASFDGLFP